jgi:hypothetical protein
VRARPGPSEDSNLGVTPALSNTYKQRRFILISYSLLRNLHTNIIGSLASKGRRVPRAESEHKRKRKHAVSIPKRLILATTSSASIADGPTLHLNLLQNVIPRTVVTLDWPECVNICGDGQ